MSRESILARIRESLGEEREDFPLPAGIPAFPTMSDPVTRFQEELEQAGGKFLDGRGSTPLRNALRQVLAETGAAKIAWENPEKLQSCGIPLVFSGAQKFEERVKDHFWISWHADGAWNDSVLLAAETFSTRTAAEIDLSVSTALWGIAETGTVVECANDGGGRILPVLCPAHVSVLSAARLLMNHEQFFQKLALQHQTSALTLVTGPSRTADIEKTLVLGVHGPRRFFVILIE